MTEAERGGWTDRSWTSRDGLELYYREYAGPGDRLAIVCLHGLTRNSRDFTGLAEHLAGDWRVITPDLMWMRTSMMRTFVLRPDASMNTSSPFSKR